MGIFFIVRVIFYTFSIVVFILIFVIVLNSSIRWIGRFNEEVVLPNGFIIKRKFDFTRMGRDDLFTDDGVTRIATNVEFLCFDDRYVALSALYVFDGRTNDLVPVKKLSSAIMSGLWKDRTVATVTTESGSEHGCSTTI